ncbi:MAG: NADH:flavin oxidoreductase/NADH oxidase [Ferrovibrio sp.]|uniref:NADH:flavin oxidoreductase/NADH oxidase n=1 Tax=Ferrovibrio sp. TaxID=1917215 RepID=UPI00391BC5BD
MSALFEPLQLRSVTLPNRIVLSPMCQYSATDGVPNEWHRIHLGRYAAAGLGLIMAEATHVSPQGRITPGCLGLYNAVQEGAIAAVAADLKRFGRTPVAIQLAHAGRKASTDLPWRGGKPLTGPEAWLTEAPSALPHGEGWHVPQALDEEGLARVKRDFIEAALRADRAGIDLIELHGAHGYLLHQFVSPISNRRNDSYGGSLDNRMRFPLEVFAAVRAAWPAHKPLGMRITGSDWMGAEGLEVADAIRFASALKELGCDFVDVSSGGVSLQQKIATGPGYQVPFAAAVKKATGMVTMAVGLITEPAQAEAIVKDGRADLVALARGLLNDPFWAWRAADALGGEVYLPPQYLRGRVRGVDVPRELLKAVR